MWNKIKLSIFVILIPLILNLNDLLYKDIEANDGTDKKKITVGRGSVMGIRIYSKIDTSSKINVDIISDKHLNQSNFYSGIAKNVGGSITKKDQPKCTYQGKTCYCIYSVTKEDDYEYGVLLITDFDLEDFAEEITISVKVISDTAFWIYIVIGVFILLALIVGVFVICRYFYRCVCCKR